MYEPRVMGHPICMHYYLIIKVVEIFSEYNSVLSQLILSCNMHSFETF